MDRVIDKGMVLALCAVTALGWSFSPLLVAAGLIGVAVAGLDELSQLNRWLRIGLALGYLGAAIFVKEAVVFVPLVSYALLTKSGARWLLAVWVIPVAAHAATVEIWPTAATGVLCVVSEVLAWRTARVGVLLESAQTSRDDLVESSRRLQAEHRDLLERNEMAERVATLSERNRIARDMHDSVGHLLTRAVLQSEVIRRLIPSDQPQLARQFAALDETIQESMSNVRASVHALRDQGLDLQAILEELARNAVGLNVGVDVAAQALPPSVAQGFAMIAREAVSNTQRHSSATSMTLAVRDFPGFYQLTITDNGPGLPADPRHSAPGLGLRSMEDRIRALGGTLRLDWKSGFTIIATVPREKES